MLSEEDTINHQPKTEKRKVKGPSEVEKTGKKRKKNPDMWKKNLAKKLKNAGQSFTTTRVINNKDGTKSKSKVTLVSKSLQPPCDLKCKLKCSQKITTEERENNFTDYWNLNDIEKQREFISSSMNPVNSRYKYSNSENPRKPNNA